MCIRQTQTHEEDIQIILSTGGINYIRYTNSVTAATLPNIEDVVMGAIPGLPKVHLHNPVLAFEQGGESFMTWFYRAERGEIDPFVLVVEGSIPNEKIKAEGYWAAQGVNQATG